MSVLDSRSKVKALKGIQKTKRDIYIYVHRFKPNYTIITAIHSSFNAGQQQDAEEFYCQFTDKICEMSTK